MKISKVINIILVLLLVAILVLYSVEIFNNSNKEGIYNELKLELTNLESQINDLKNENESLRNDNYHYLMEDADQQIEINRCSETNFSSETLEYDYSIVEAELNKSWQEIELLRNSLNQYKQNRETTSKTILNMYNPYTIKKGETYAGLTIEEVSKYEDAFLSYTIKFKGEFQVTGNLEYSDIGYKGYFFNVKDGLDKMPYQINNLNYPISFFIGESDELKAKGVNDGDLVTAIFSDYVVQSIPGKPTVNSAKLIKVIEISR